MPSRAQKNREKLEDERLYQDESLDPVNPDRVDPADSGDGDRPGDDDIEQAVSEEEGALGDPVNGANADGSEPQFSPESVQSQFTVSRPELPEQPPLANQSKVVAPEASAAPTIAQAGVDTRFATPDTHIKASAEPAAVGGDAWFQRAQEQLVAEQVHKVFEKLGLNPADIRAAMLGGTSAVPDQTGGAPFVNAAQIPTFKYHFRCDVAPDLAIQALDMGALDRGEDPRVNPIPGVWIRFRMGHLQTNDDNVARQIKYMMERPSIGADGQTVGGNPSIYEDDGSVIFKCPDCDFVTASKNGYQAHRRATHGA